MPDLVQWTRELVLALPEDGQRYELLDGELLVTPSPRPRHQVIVGEIALRLAAYVQSAGIGRVLASPADLFGRMGQLLQPDLFVVPSRNRTRRPPAPLPEPPSWCTSPPGSRSPRLRTLIRPAAAALLVALLATAACGGDDGSPDPDPTSALREQTDALFPAATEEQAGDLAELQCGHASTPPSLRGASAASDAAIPVQRAEPSRPSRGLRSLHRDCRSRYAASQ